MQFDIKKYKEIMEHIDEDEEDSIIHRQRYLK